jgi:multicomponent Na+:H+ antiporter subunit E
MRLARRLALLVILWLLAWDRFSLANVASGLVVAAALLVAFPVRRRPEGRVRIMPLGAVRLGLYVGEQLIVSNLVMAREILRRRPHGHPAVLAHRLGAPSEEVVTLMTSVIALSPGTMTADVDRDSSTIYVHFFSVIDREDAHAGLAKLERLAVATIVAPSDARDPTDGVREDGQ